MEYEDLVLKVQKAVVSQAISRDMLADINVAHYVDDIAGNLVIRLSAFIACTEEQAVRTFRYPSTAWEHIKEAYFPKYLLRRFPVKYTEITVNAAETFPNLKIRRGARSFTIRTVKRLCSFHE